MPHSPNHPPAGLHLIVAAAGICAVAAVLQPDPANAQSFDCRQVRHQDEMRICEEPELAQLDQQLAVLYREQFAKIPQERQDEFQRHEALFVNARRKCRDDYFCIEQSYRNRIKELEGLLSEARGEDATRDSEGPATSDHHVRLNRTTAAAPTASAQPREASGSTTEHATENAPATNDAPAKPTIRWVDPPPAR